MDFGCVFGMDRRGYRNSAREMVRAASSFSDLEQAVIVEFSLRFGVVGSGNLRSRDVYVSCSKLGGGPLTCELERRRLERSCMQIWT